MPRIPYNNLPSVGPGQVPDVRLSPQAPESAFGYGPAADEAYGQAHGLATDAAKMLFAEHQKQQRESDEANVNDAIVKLSALKNKLVFDPNGGLMSKKGDAAFAAYTPTLDAFKKGAAEINDSLITPEQKALFQRHLVGEHVNLDGTLSRYISGEIEQKKLGSAAAAVETMSNDAIAAAMSNPAALPDKLSQQRTKAEEFAALQGITDPVAKAQYIDAGISKTNLGIVHSMLAAGQDLTASKYFEDNKDGFKGADLINAQNAVGSGSILGEAQRAVAQVFTRGRDFTDPTETGSRDGMYYSSEKEALDALANVTKDMSPRVQQKAEELAIRQYNVEKLADQQARNDRYEKMAESLRTGSTLESLERSPEWQGISESHKEGIERMANNMAKTDSPYAKVNDPVKTADFWAMSDEEMFSMSKADLLKLVPYVTEAKYSEMEKHWSAARNKEVEFRIRDEDEKYMREFVAQNELGGIKVRKGGMTVEEKKAYEPIAEEIRAKLNAAAGEKRGRLPQNERQQIIRDYVIDKVIHEDKRSWGTRHGWKAAFGLPIGLGWGVLGAGLYGGGRALDAYRGVSVSDEERGKISKFISDRGGAVSDEKVVALKRAESMGASVSELERLAGE